MFRGGGVVGEVGKIHVSTIWVQDHNRNIRDVSLLGRSSSWSSEEGVFLGSMVKPMCQQSGCRTITGMIEI